ncbi:thioredoxin family protein [Microbacterium elymi]|uniref:Thioredoxin family protein n=1 Tax=Microbacterium elymi TaxID=2909587 RepID=A0ABY5NNS8_9MICO|nr:thioredoxin family protein [Microbacterium elymi]UUT36701.1 thioredoxin family protein [Microbacterium elymi]
MPLWIAVLAVAVLVAVTLVVGGMLRHRDGRARRVADRTIDVATAETGPRGERATLVQFSTELCARCPQVRRMLDVIAGERAGVLFTEVDLTRRPDLAKRLHILQTPTVFVLDADGFVHTRFAGVPAAQAVTGELDRLIGDPARV